MKKIILFAFLLGNVALYGQSTVATINKGYKLNAGQYLDTRMGTILAGKSVPYSGVSAANAAIFPSFRCVGMTVLIDTLGSMKEYWYLAGTANGNLVEKAGGGSTYTAGYGMLLSSGAFRTDTTVIASKSRLAAALTIKQDALISGTNIKTLGGNSLLGSGDFEVITPLQTVGGTATQLSINQATTGSDGYLSSTDWNTFNNKKNAADSTTASPANYVTQYQRKKTSDSLAALISAVAGWSLTGNAGTTAGTNFIGTTDGQDPVFKRNNTFSGRIGSSDTYLGVSAGALSHSGNSNTAIGASALAGITGASQNTAVGVASLLNLTSGSNNTSIGAYALRDNTTGGGNIAIGIQAGYYNTTLSNQIFINSINRTNFNGDTTASPVYIVQNSTVANQRTKINGRLQVVDGTQGSGKVFTSDANGVGSWQTPSGGGSSADSTTFQTNFRSDTMRTRLNNSIPFFNVRAYGAVGDSATDDRAAIKAAYDAMPARGGTLYFPAGRYRISDSIIIDKPITILGDGMTSGYNDSVYLFVGTQIPTVRMSEIIAVSPTKPALELRKPVIIEKIGFEYTGSTPSAGNTALLFTKSHSMKMDKVSVGNFYDGIHIQQKTAEYSIHASGVWGMHRYGIWAENTDIVDYGDQSISNCYLSPYRRNATAAIYVTSGGGLKMVNNKINGTYNGPADIKRFTYGVHVKNSLGITAALLIANNSIENITTSGIRLEGTYDYYNYAITGNQVAYYGTPLSEAIYIGDNFKDGSVTGNSISCDVATSLNGIRAVPNNTILSGNSITDFKGVVNAADIYMKGNMHIRDSLGATSAAVIIDNPSAGLSGHVRLRDFTATRYRADFNQYGVNGLALNSYDDVAATYLPVAFDGSKIVLNGALTGGVSIGTTTPAASASLDVTSTTKGFLPPRMTTTQMNAISSPAFGLEIFNITDSCKMFYNGSRWQWMNKTSTYIPTYTSTANIASTVVSAVTYTLNGNMITLAGEVEFGITTPTTATELRISLPSYVTNNFTATSQGGGTTFNDGSSNVFTITPVTGTTLIAFKSLSPSLTSSYKYPFTVSFRIL